MSERVLISNFRWGLTGELQSMMIENGRVSYRGPSFDSKAIIPTIDLSGHFLLPPLIDSHCHVISSGLFLGMLNLGQANSLESVLDTVRDAVRNGPEGWLMAVHYDQNKWGGPHVTRDQLDSISDQIPILLRHVNGHAGIANSAALHAAGLTDSEPNPPGGSYGRDASGRIDGTLFENGLTRISGAIPKPTLEAMVEAILTAGRTMKAYGLGCVHDMMVGSYDLDLELEAYRIAAERGNPVDVRLYIQWEDAMSRGAQRRENLKSLTTSDDPRKAVVAGVKLFADGAIGSATAAIYGAYEGGPPDSNHSGQLMYPPERLTTMVREAENAGWAVSTHAIGDYAADLVMNAYEAASEPKKHRIEHAMMLSDAQIERMQKLGVSVSMQPEFLFRFGPTYRSQLGPNRASVLNRAQSLASAGVPLSLSSDRPIVSGDPWLGISTSVERPDGFDQSENLTIEQALDGYLGQAAAIGGNDPTYASLTEGSEARAIVLNRDPREPGVTPEDVTWLAEILGSLLFSKLPS